MRRVLTAIAGSLALMGTPAAAAIVWSVDATFVIDTPQVPSFTASATTPWSTRAGYLSGTFTTNDSATEVIALNLVSSAFGAFRETIYNDLRYLDGPNVMPQHFRLTVPMGGMTQQLQLFFTPLLGTGPIDAYGVDGHEHQEYAGSGNRILGGAVERVTAEVPEPTTWALLIVGFGLTGAALRSRRVAIPA